MSPSEPTPFPPLLAEARSQFAEWRSSRLRSTERIPPALWKAAACCAARFGIHPTARTLGLDYAALKRHMPTVAKATPAVASPFVELVAPAVRPSSSDCVIEVENRSGGKLRLELRGAMIPDLIDLARRFGRDEG